MKWVRIEDIGISKKKYEQVIKKYPVVKELEDFINKYNDFMADEYNSVECEGGEIFKKILNLLSKN